MSGFHTESLSRPVTAAEVRAFRQRRRAGVYGPTGSTVGATLVTVGAVLIAAVVVVGLIGTTALQVLSPFAGSHGFSLTRLAPLIGAVVAVAALWSVLSRAARSGTVRGLVRLARFADENGLRFALRSPAPTYPGLLFTLGHSRCATNHLWSERGLFADCGGYEYSVGTGEDRETYEWNFAAFRLPRPMPHLVLDARANNRLSGTNLPVGFAASQRLTLGAPFDDHFTMYAPEGYGHDAFYLLPPDLVSMLVDAPVDIDIEVVDSWLFFYTQSALDPTDPDTWRLLDRIRATVAQRFAEMSTRYTDRRLAEGTPDPHTTVRAAFGPGGVAAGGRRMRAVTNWRAVALTAVVVVAWIVLQNLI